MGTNYFAVRNRPTISSPIHIGKSSVGWLFLFQEQNKPWNDPPVVWNTYEQVKDWLRKHTVDSTDYVIIDEYEDVIYFMEFVNLVESKQKDEFCKNNPDNFSDCRNVNGYRFTDEDFS